MDARPILDEGRIDTRPPRLFGSAAVLIICAYGLVLAIPFLLSLVVVSLLKLSPLTVLLPLAFLAYSVLFLPVGFGNPWIARRLRRLKPAGVRDEDLFVVQLSLRPRLRRGPRAMLEDADDFGWLWFTPAGLEFRGDSVDFSLPYGKVQSVVRRSIGYRGMFLYGDRIEVATPVAGLAGFEIAERSSWLLTSSRSLARRLYQSLRQHSCPAD